MNRSDLSRLIADDSGASPTVVEQVLDSLDRTLLDTVATGGELRWAGLFTLDVTARAARTGRNPQTGGTIDIPAGPQVRLRPGSRLKGAARTAVGA